MRPEEARLPLALETSMAASISHLTSDDAPPRRGAPWLNRLVTLPAMPNHAPRLRTLAPALVASARDPDSCSAAAARADGLLAAVMPVQAPTLKEAPVLDAILAPARSLPASPN
jgi:hypothetical protein